MSLQKKIVRTIRENKSQYIGAALLILFCCALFVAFNTMGVNVQNNLAAFKKDNVQEDAFFVLSGPLNGIDKLESDYGVLLEERRACDLDYAADTTLRILSATSTVDRYEVTGGTDLAKPGDLLIDPAFAKAHDIVIGDTLRALGSEFTVVGFVCTPDYIYPLKQTSDMTKNPDAFGIAVVAKEDFPAQGYGYAFYSVKYRNTEIGAFKRTVEQSNTVVTWADKENNMRISFIEGDIKGVGPMATVIPMAILLVTSLLVVVVLWRLLKREFSQIGVLYALGFRRSELLRHYLRYPLILAAVGGLLGAGAGLLAARPFIGFVSTFYNLPVFSIVISAPVVALSVALPFLALVPAAWLVIWLALRQTPLQLIKGGAKRAKINRLEKSLRMNNLKFSAKFKVREVLRNVPRTLLMLFGVVFASALLLIGFAMNDSMTDLMRSSFNNTYLYDTIYQFNTLQTAAPAAGERASAAPFRVAEENGTENIFIYGIEPDARLIRLADQNGKLLDYRQTIVTQSLMERYHLSVGDTVTVQNTLTGHSTVLTVGGVTKYFLGDYIYIPLSQLNAMLGFPADSYTMLYADQKLDIPSSGLIASTSRQYVEDGFNTLLKPMLALSAIIGVMACIIGLIILYIVISLVIEENKNGISLMKVLGYGNKNLYPLILNPYIWLVVIGYALSIPLVLVSLQRFFAVMTAEMSMSIPAKLTPLHIAVGFAIILVTYQLTKLLNRRKIDRIDMSVSLKTGRE